MSINQHDLKQTEVKQISVENIFSFHGGQLYPYLKNCPIHPERQEKELPTAIKMLNENEPKQIICFGREEHILDLTSAQDIAAFDEM